MSGVAGGANTASSGVHVDTNNSIDSTGSATIEVYGQGTGSVAGGGAATSGIGTAVAGSSGAVTVLEAALDDAEDDGGGLAQGAGV